jgi:hypothetical protein
MAHLRYCKKCYESGHVVIVKPSKDLCFECECIYLQSKLKAQQELIDELHEQLELAHAHIHNMQDAYNECRNWFSNVEYIPESEELDEYISLSDCDVYEAVKLRDTTEDFAMGWFRYWYALIKDRYQIKTLKEYVEWSDKNLDKLQALAKL